MSDKRRQKQEIITKAAQKLFAQIGYQNTKMSTIAEEAGVSKGTIYFYFKSKENLYMAIAFKGLSMLNDLLYESIHESKRKTGLEGTIAIVDAYLEFGQSQPLLTTAVLDYMSLVRASKYGKDETKVTKALKESLFFTKLGRIHNEPLKMFVQEVQRGWKDESVKNQSEPAMMYLTAWALILGYLKLSGAAISPTQTIYRVNMKQWRSDILEAVRRYLSE